MGWQNRQRQNRLPLVLITNVLQTSGCQPSKSIVRIQQYVKPLEIIAFLQILPDAIAKIFPELLGKPEIAAKRENVKCLFFITVLIFSDYVYSSWMETAVQKVGPHGNCVI